MCAASLWSFLILLCTGRDRFFCFYLTRFVRSEHPFPHSASLTCSQVSGNHHTTMNLTGLPLEIPHLGGIRPKYNSSKDFGMGSWLATREHSSLCWISALWGLATKRLDICICIIVITRRTTHIHTHTHSTSPPQCDNSRVRNRHML